MAKYYDSANPKYCIVEYGDTLSEIAAHWNTTYQSLASINGISNPNLIYVNQKICAASGGSPSPSQPTTTSNSSKMVMIQNFGVEIGTERTLFVFWTWDKNSTTENYKIRWYYDPGDGASHIGSETTVSSSSPLQNTWTPPEHAVSCSVYILPVSKTKTVNGSTTSYWSSSWSTKMTHYFSNNPPSVPSVPSVEISDYQLTASLDNISGTATHIQFEITKDDTTVFKTATVAITTAHAAYTCIVADGGVYKVRCRGVKDSKYSNWSNYSSPVKSAPSQVSGITECRATSSTSVYLAWPEVPSANTYEIQYTTDKRYFDGSDQVQTITGIETTHYEKSGLESGKEYFFRIRSASNNSQYSNWSEIISLKLGEKPDYPTTWSETTTAIVGETVKLYWVHNSKDGSNLTKSVIEITINGTTTTYEIVNPDPEETNTGSYYVNTSGYTEGTKIHWRVKTKGVLDDYSDYSMLRTVDVYAPPSLSITFTDSDENPISEITSFPFYMDAIASPNVTRGHHPIGYNVNVISTEAYETNDEVGKAKIVRVGESIYSKSFDVSDDLFIEFLPNNINLENNITYTFKCTVTMNSGLITTDSVDLPVSWDEDSDQPNLEISINQDDVSVNIHPYCEDLSGHEVRNVLLSVYRKEFDGGFTEIVKNLDVSGGTVITNGNNTMASLKLRSEPDYFASTITTLPIGYSVTITGNPVYSVKTLYDDVWIREKPDGTGTILEKIVTAGAELELAGDSNEEFTKVKHGNIVGWVRSKYISWEAFMPATAVKSGRTYNGWVWMRYISPNSVFITDPHPSLDYARYRVVSKKKDTGHISFYDPPSYPIGEKAIIIQWDETWSDYINDSQDPLTKDNWSGSLLRLPYNVDVSENNDIDVELVEYIGRKHPVSYYGTQLGQTANWNVEIDRKDTETIYALRRLAVWPGDVYVREPSGSGYWAKVNVSFSQTHCELTIPVTFDITRVEGGM